METSTKSNSVPAIGSVIKELPPPSCRRTIAAATMLLHALEFDPSYTAADAMKAVCFTEEQCKNPVLQHRVHRQKDKILEERVPLLVALSTPRSKVSPLTEPGDADPVPTTKAITASTGKENSTGVSEGIGASITKRKSIEEALQQSLAATASDVPATAAKKTRQTNAEVLSRRAEKEERSGYEINDRFWRPAT